MIKATFFVLITILYINILVNATRYHDCQNGKDGAKNIIKSVDILGCENPPCKLRRGTKTTLHETFVPNHNIRQLKTSVKAVILGISLPFIGVDNVDASKDIYTADGQKADWPLIAGNEYLYKNTFSVEKFYPTVSPVVHWSLMDGNQIVTCFVVNAKIL